MMIVLKLLRFNRHLEAIIYAKTAKVGTVTLPHSHKAQR